MTEFKGTPGPWAVNEDGWKVESDKEHGWVNDGWIICKLEGPDAKTNARLIASAPDLLNAAQTALSVFEVEYITDGREDLIQFMELIRAAIAKALGETNA